MAACAKPCKPSANDESDDIMATKIKTFEIDGKKWILPATWEQQGEGFRNFKSRPDDVWIMTQPRSGTTLTQELVWLLMNNLDFETSKKFHLSERSFELAFSLFPGMWKKCRVLRPSLENPKELEALPVDTTKPAYEVYADVPSPRVIKTHFALSVHKDILDSGCKIVYMMRNPKDMMISRARFGMSGPQPFYSGTIQDALKIYIEEDGPWGPYWQHVKEACDHRDHPNLLFMYYEELRTNLPAAIKKIAAFLGKSYTDEQVGELAAHLDIDSFRKNPMVNELPGCNIPSFIGKGRVDGWKEIFTPELEAAADRWIEENTKGTDIMLPYRQK